MLAANAAGVSASTAYTWHTEDKFKKALEKELATYKEWIAKSYEEQQKELIESALKVIADNLPENVGLALTVLAALKSGEWDATVRAAAGSGGNYALPLVISKEFPPSDKDG